MSNYKPGDTAICAHCGKAIKLSKTGYWWHLAVSQGCHLPKPAAEKTSGLKAKTGTCKNCGDTIAKCTGSGVWYHPVIKTCWKAEV